MPERITTARGAIRGSQQDWQRVATATRYGTQIRPGQLVGTSSNTSFHQRYKVDARIVRPCTDGV
jgi:hypothetical protein